MWQDDEPGKTGQTDRGWGAVRTLLAELTVAVLTLAGLGAGALLPDGLQLDALPQALAQRAQAWGSEALAAAWRSATAHGSVGTQQEVRALPPFRRVEVRGAVRVVLRPGGSSARVTGAPLLRERVLTRVVDGTLTVTVDEDAPAAHASLVEVAVPALEAIEASLGSVLVLEGLSAEGLSLRARGGSQVHATGLQLGRLQVVASSGSRVRLSGEGVDELHLHASSGSALLAQELPVRRLCVRASGGARIEAQAEVSLAGQLSDASQLVVLGHPPERVLATATSATIQYL
jgi:hypothetical protein